MDTISYLEGILLSFLTAWPYWGRSAYDIHHVTDSMPSSIIFLDVKPKESSLESAAC